MLQLVLSLALTCSAALSTASGPLSGAMPSTFARPGGRNVILFDGVCNFCNRWVQFVVDNDQDGNFCFASMQSNAGRQLLTECGRPADDLSTFVLIDEEASLPLSPPIQFAHVCQAHLCRTPHSPPP